MEYTEAAHDGHRVLSAVARVAPPTEKIKDSRDCTGCNWGNADTKPNEKQANDSCTEPGATEVEGTGTERAEEELQKERYALALLMLAAWAGCFSSHESSVANALAVTTGGQNADTVAAARVIIRLLEVILEKGPVGTETAVPCPAKMHGGGPTRGTRRVDVVFDFSCSSVRRSSSSYWVVSLSGSSTVLGGSHSCHGDQHGELHREYNAPEL